MPLGQPINPAPVTGQGSANRPSHGGYNAGQGLTGNSGTITISAASYGGFTTVPSNVLASSSLSLDNLTMDTGKREVDLPSITFRCEEDGRWFTLRLQPEHTMTPFECLQLTRLISNTLPKSFDVIGFVRKNNLEKHFKFE